MIDLVRSRQVAGRHASLQYRAGMPQRIGAAIDGQLGIDAPDQAALIGIGRHAVYVLA